MTFGGAVSPCGSSVKVDWGDLVLASFTKFGNLGLADSTAAFIGPVISSGFSQKSEQAYLRFQASYNKTEFDQILDNKWYLQSQFDKLVAELKAIYDERQPDVALFGESHCQVQPYQFLAADATIGMHAAAGYVAGLVEEPADSQRYYDRLIAISQIKNTTPEQRQAAEAFE